MYRTERSLYNLKACIAARYDLVDWVCKELQRFMHDSGLQKSAFSTLTGVREAMINAIGHGAQENPRTEVCLSASIADNTLVIKIKDPGVGFDWQKTIATSENQLHSKGNFLPERGRGISILLHYFDHVSFNEAGNELEMHLVIDRPSHGKCGRE